MRRSLHKTGGAAVASLLLAASVAALGCPPASRATTLERLTLSQLSRHAVTVVQGTVVASSVRQTSVGVRTQVRLRVTRSLKGAPCRFLTVSVPGGLLPDGTRVAVGGMPSLVAGESSVVFVDVFGGILGGQQGALAVRDDRIAVTGESLPSLARRVDAALGRAVSGSVGAASAAPAASPARAGAPGIAVPVISAIDPPAASAGTGSSVTITGSGFGATSGRVLFSYGRRGVTQMASTAIRSWGPESITCVVPTGTIDDYEASAGSGPVVVVTALGAQSNAVDFSVPFGYGAAKWPRTPVTYLLNTSGVDSALRSSLVDAGADMWNQIGTDFAFRDGGTSSTGLGRDGANVISWGAGLEFGVLAVTYAFIDGAVIREIDVKFSDSVAWGEGLPATNTYDIQSITSHELGHWLALLDQYMDADAEKIMYGYAGKDEQRRTPAQGDIAGIQWIYGGGPAPTPTPSVSPTLTPTPTPTASPIPTLTPTASPTPTPTPEDVGPVCAARSASVRRGGICRIQYRVSDDASLVVTRTIRITTITGVVKKSSSGVTQSSASWQSFRFKCDLRKGTYRIVVTAQDLQGHPASVVGRATLTVK
jgi:hypothetical protein